MTNNSNEANRIAEVVRHFIIEVNQFTEERRIRCEVEPIFHETFEVWKRRLGLRCTYESAKKDMLGRKFIEVYRRLIIITTGGRAEARKVAINARLGNLVDRPRLLENKGGIVISEFPPNNARLTRGNNYDYLITIQTGPAGGSLTNIFPVHGPFRYATVAGRGSHPIPFPVAILPNYTYNIIVTFTPDTDAGVEKHMLYFDFFSGTPFTIGRTFSANIGDDAVHGLLQPVEPFRKPIRSSTRNQGLPQYVPGVPPPADNSTYYAPLHFKISHSWRTMCKLLQASDLLLQMRDQLSVVNLQDLYHKLLWTEELMLDKEIERYDMNNAVLEFRHNRQFLALRVPGLSEKRPSVQKGDQVIAVYPNQPAVKYVGYVHQIESEHALLKFDHDKFQSKYRPGTPVNIEFTYSRMQLRVCHQGIDKLTPDMLNYITAPGANTPATAPHWVAPGTINIHPVDRRLNEEQLRAVRNIVRHSNVNRGCPYVLFGPPGTGKTSTIVEAILQVGIHRPNAKILICAPSNAAADVLISRLARANLPASDLFRFNSYQRNPESVALEARAFGMFDNAVKAFKFPGLEKFLTFKYVVATCCMAGKLINYGVEKGHFTTVFVDEAGHGWEPEVLASFSGLLDLTSHSKGVPGQLVLAGDPQQLGPIVRADAVDDEHGGLSISLLERLITTHPAYRRDLAPDSPFAEAAGYDPSVLTMLLKCYRCHPDILRLPNEMFYNNALQAAASTLVTNNMLNWSGLPNPRFPLVFHGVEGENTREGNSPSWFNVEEIEIVWKYVRDLVGRHRVPASDIAVITPYHKQVTKIQHLFRQSTSTHRGAYQDVAVGSCEQLQGQERRVIIISTVRSSTEFLEQDRHFNLGFVASPKRFNVAVTRAKALLIVIGNPHLLNTDRHWRRLLRFCIQNRGYTGCTPPAIDQDPPGGDEGGIDGPPSAPAANPDGPAPPAAPTAAPANVPDVAAVEHAFAELDLDWDETGEEEEGKAEEDDQRDQLDVGWVHLEA